MTDPYARPADQPADGEVTIPLVPDAGFTQPSQPPFADETLVDPLGPSPWASGGQDFGYTPTPGYSTPTPGSSTSAGSQPPDAGGYPGAADYWRGPTTADEMNQPQASGPGAGQPYVQPTYQPSPAPPVGPHSQAQTGYAQPHPGHTEPIASAVYQPYPQAGQSNAPQWPAVVPDPVRPEYGYHYGPGVAATDHPNAIPALVLGIIGLVLFPLVAPVAWHLGAKGQREARLDPNRWRASGALAAGKVLGIIGTTLMGLGVLFVVFIIMALVVVGA